MGRSRAGPIVFWLVFVASALLRVAHVAFQAGTDPTFSHPSLDAEHYLQWARALASGAGEPPGAFYLAPLYPHFLAAWLTLIGDRLPAVLLVQHALTLAAAALLAATARRAAGSIAGISAAALFLFYQPTVYFPSRLLSESLAVFFVCFALRLAGIEGSRWAIATGALLGLAGLTRPNLLLIPAVWIAGEAIARRWRRAACLAACTAAILAPVTIRNLVVSGHPVLVSSNGGITLFHGNGPGALGTFNPPAGFSGALAFQREEATALARLRTGVPLDDVQADHWWGRQAIRTRLEDPGATIALLLTKLVLTVDDYEHGLDEPPMMDTNRWACLWSLPGTSGGGGLPRRVSWVPFAVIFGLAMAAAASRGLPGSGGWRVWSAIAACALTPLVFYVSSRYRLPMACLLVIPAGVGLAVLSGQVAVTPRRRRSGWIVCLACAAASFFVPFRGLRMAEEAGALTNRAVALRQAGDSTAAERVVRQAIEVDRESTAARYVLAVVLERSGRDAEAEEEYRRVVMMDAGHAEAAGNLAGLLTRTGRPAEGVPILRTALAMRPGHRVCTINLVVALTAAGDSAGARQALAEAQRQEVPLDPELVRLVEGS